MKQRIPLEPQLKKQLLINNTGISLKVTKDSQDLRAIWKAVMYFQCHFLAIFSCFCPSPYLCLTTFLLLHIASSVGLPNPLKCCGGCVREIEVIYRRAMAYAATPEVNYPPPTQERHGLDLLLLLGWGGSAWVPIWWPHGEGLMSEHWVPPDASPVVESGCINQREWSTQSPRAWCWDGLQYKFIFYSQPNCRRRNHRGLSCSNSFDWLCYGNQKNKSTLFSHLSVPQVLLLT